MSKVSPDLKRGKRVMDGLYVKLHVLTETQQRLNKPSVVSMFLVISHLFGAPDVEADC